MRFHKVHGVTRADVKDVPTTNGVYFFRGKEGIVYIGKSVNLRARLLSHIENARIDQKENSIIRASTEIDFIITDSEFKALLLEATLIRMHKPRFNVRWRDDKSYLYIKISVGNIFPKVSITRREQDGMSRYFGPFSSMRTAQKLLRELRRIVPFCMQPRITQRSCFYSKIGLCNPCPNMITHSKDSELQKKYTAIYRKNIRLLIRILSGKSDQLILSYQRTITILTKKERFEEAIPYRNSLLRLEKMVMYSRFGDELDSYDASKGQLAQLTHLLKPFFGDLQLSRIECYDMSTFLFKDSTASMVVWTEGLSDKKEYKRFKIKNPTADSDFEMFKEVLRRRFARSWTLPDLVVVDGGKPQVRTTRAIFRELNISIPVIGIAKRPDRFIIGNKDFTCLRPRSDDPGMLIVQSMRDEAHRFARGYHVKLREQKLMV